MSIAMCVSDIQHVTCMLGHKVCVCVCIRMHGAIKHENARGDTLNFYGSGIYATGCQRFFRIRVFIYYFSLFLAFLDSQGGRNFFRLKKFILVFFIIFGDPQGGHNFFDGKDSFRFV